MLRKRLIVVIMGSILLTAATSAQTASTTSTAATTQTELTEQLYDMLNAGDIFSGVFDKQSEMEIAQIELKLAQTYLTSGDRKLAIILGIQARKTMQRALGDPYNSAMIPIYSILVQLYEGSYDKELPNTNAADPKKARMYREAIEHIHAR